jgi:hypothetical protein
MAIHIGREKAVERVSRCRNLFYNAPVLITGVFAYFYKKNTDSNPRRSIHGIKPTHRQF